MARRNRVDPHLRKQTNTVVTPEFLEARASAAAASGYQKAKWIVFSEAILAMGLSLTLYEAWQTFSKYLTVRDGSRLFKVRFSNHRPIKRREIAGDCDFFVGVTNLGVTTTEDALRAVAMWRAATVKSP